MKRIPYFGVQVIVGKAYFHSQLSLSMLDLDQFSTWLLLWSLAVLFFILQWKIVADRMDNSNGRTSNLSRTSVMILYKGNSTRWPPSNNPRRLSL